MTRLQRVWLFRFLSAKYMCSGRGGIRFLLSLAIIVLAVGIWLVNETLSPFNNLKVLQLSFSKDFQALSTHDSDVIMSEESLTNVVVVGGSYVGLVSDTGTSPNALLPQADHTILDQATIKELANILPKSHRVSNNMTLCRSKK